MWTIRKISTSIERALRKGGYLNDQVILNLLILVNVIKSVCFRLNEWLKL